MKISEKQIMKLIHLANGYKDILMEKGQLMLVEDILDFLCEIMHQQSDELKEVE